MEATRATVLVIDDEDVILGAARRILTAQGFRVVTVGGAEDALARLVDIAPVAAVVDLKLPGMSGLAFMERARELLPSLVVIVTTGYSSMDNAVASLRQGAFDFLPKPFTFDELLSPVFRACRYLDLPTPERERYAARRPAGYYFLGLQTWARPEEDGTARIGLTELFVRTTAAPVAVRLPSREAFLRQGAALLHVTNGQGRTHVTWSPLSGRVLAINEALANDPAPLTDDPFHEGWVARIRPANLKHELSRLEHGAEAVA